MNVPNWSCTKLELQQPASARLDSPLGPLGGVAQNKGYNKNGHIIYVYFLLRGSGPSGNFCFVQLQPLGQKRGRQPGALKWAFA